MSNVRLIQRLIVLFTCLLFTSIISQSFSEFNNDLTIKFNGDGKFEVGSPFIGIELHHTSPLLQRISFYYPVANSIDLSTDYWTRDTSFISSMAMQIDDVFELIGDSNFELEVTPFSLKFINKNEFRSIEISYHFAKNKPAMLEQIEITNLSDRKKNFRFITYQDASLRTSHTFALKNKAHTRYYKKGNALIAEYYDSETQNVSLFSINTGEQSKSFTSIGDYNLVNSNKKEYFKKIKFDNSLLTKENSGKAAFTYLYEKDIPPGEKLIVKQIIGSATAEEINPLVNYLVANYENEVEEYENYILTKSCKGQVIKTNDEIVDHSVQWALAILETNNHYIDGDFVPMPCPAEYNFFFTHDVLLTNLAVVNFNTERVKHDLQFIIKHADGEHTIPHAYYWKDSEYVTEYAGADNWNHFWFIINCASYLRHTNDRDFLKELYPFIEKSLDLVMKNKKEDDLIWAYQPDWWDIGSKFGPRAYMTILAVKTIRDFIFVSSVLNKNINKLKNWEDTSSKMIEALRQKLWNSEKNYLMNFYEAGVPDPHFYTGSLLAAHFNLLEKEKQEKLVNTASNVLLDPEIGIYNVYPMDYNELQSYLDLQPNEAGAPFYYANGGVWPHGSAWYALGLISDDKKNEALEFVKKNMTVKGIMNGPNGQPAMYEYRVAKKSDPEVYGIVDKPQFLWAGGWYLYVMYHLLILNENEWNISLEPYYAENMEEMNFTIDYFGRKSKIVIDEQSKEWDAIKMGDKIIPTTILPAAINITDTIELIQKSIPSLNSTEAVLNGIEYSEDLNTLTLKLSAFPRHTNITKIISPIEPQKILIDNQEHSNYGVKLSNGKYLISFEFIHPSAETIVQIKF